MCKIKQKTDNKGVKVKRFTKVCIWKNVWEGLPVFIIFNLKNIANLSESINYRCRNKES